MGATGRELGRIARAFGMKVLAVTEHPQTKTYEDRTLVDLLGGPDRLDHLISQSDYISLHVPLSDKTRKMVNQEFLNRMKPTACLINVARGGLVDRDALYQALFQRRIAGAGVDVHWQYPPNPEDPIYKLENLIATPHMAGFTTENYLAYARIISENILRISREETPMNVVNRELLNL